jgi:signal transduction histidine kinase
LERPCFGGTIGVRGDPPAEPGMVRRESVGADELVERLVARQVAEPLEWATFAYQAWVLLQVALVDRLPPGHRDLVVVLAAVHVCVAVALRWVRGPVARRGWWLVAWIASMAAIPALVAVLATHGSFASDPNCVQACTYPAAPLLLVGLYPWTFAPFVLRRFVGPGLIALLAALWLVLAVIENGDVTWTSARSISSSVIWVAVAYAAGCAARGVARIALRSQMEDRQRSVDGFVSFLHSHVKAGLAAVEREAPDVPGMLEKVGDLLDVVGERRIEMLLSEDQVPVALLCSERIRVFIGLVAIAESPRVGARTVSGDIGRLLDRTLGDLLKNAVVHGAATVWIRFASVEPNIVLEVIDDGPGFDDEVLDDPGRSLHRLREAARALHGDLTKQAGLEQGSHLVLTVPETLGRAATRGGR